MAFQVRSITDPRAVRTTNPYPGGKTLAIVAGLIGIGFIGATGDGNALDTTAFEPIAPGLHVGATTAFGAQTFLASMDLVFSSYRLMRDVKYVCQGTENFGVNCLRYYLQLMSGIWKTSTMKHFCLYETGQYTVQYL